MGLRGAINPFHTKSTVEINKEREEDRRTAERVKRSDENERRKAQGKERDKCSHCGK